MNNLRLAELVSAATRLPLIAVPLFLAVGAETAGVRGLLWAVLCIFLTSGLSLLYLVYLTRSGKVSDPRAIPRIERVGPLRVVSALHAAAFLLVSLIGGPAELRAALLSSAASRGSRRGRRPRRRRRDLDLVPTHRLVGQGLRSQVSFQPTYRILQTRYEDGRSSRLAESR